jgi:two-component system nitrate/nitrite response regulator NarL
MALVEVAVVDSNNLVRGGLVSLLSAMGFSRVEESASINELTQPAAGRAAPEIVLSDLPRGVDEAADAIRRIGAWAPEAKVVFLANDLDIELLSACYAAGVFGVLMKNISREALLESLRLVGAGEKVFPSRLASLLPGLFNHIGETRLNGVKKLDNCGLSEREIGILRCLINGQSNKVIATNLEIAESTVKVHLKSILRKTGARNRTQAAIWALDHVQS